MIQAEGQPLIEDLSTLAPFQPRPTALEPETRELEEELTFPRPLKEKPHHQNLQHRHPHHHHHLNRTKLKDPLLRTPHRAKIPILSRAEILLHPIHRAQLPTNFKHQILQLVVCLCWCARTLRQQSGGGRGPSRALDGDFEVDVLVSEGGHGVGEAEGVLAGGLRGEDVVALTLFFAGEDLFFGGAEDGVVDVEGAAGLDLERGDVLVC